MKTLSDCVRRAKEIAKQDSNDGFRYHVNLHPFSDRIEKLTGKMAELGFSNKDRNEVEIAWENSL